MRFYEPIAQRVILEEEREVELGKRAGTNLYSLPLMPSEAK